MTASLPDTLAELQVRRKFYIGVINKQTNAAKALVRRALGFQTMHSEEDRERDSARAAHIVAVAFAGKEQKPEDAAIAAAVEGDLLVVDASLEPHRKAREGIEKEMKKLVRELPVYPWAKSVHGFGDLGLAVIIAEAGDLSSYPTKGHLWKRLGLAPLDGKAMSTWRREGGLSADEWVEAGYNPRRRAEMYGVVADPLFRLQTMVSGPYRAVYDRRRAAAALTHPDWTKGHAHADASRVMTKYLLRDLWREWNRAAHGVVAEEVIQSLAA